MYLYIIYTHTMRRTHIDCFGNRSISCKSINVPPQQAYACIKESKCLFGVLFQDVQSLINENKPAYARGVCSVALFSFLA